MREQLFFTIRALGYSVHQSPAQLQDLRVTEYVFCARCIQEVGLHFRGHRSVSSSEFGYDGQPHCDVRGRHEGLAGNDLARPFEILAEGHQEGTFSIPKGVKLKPVMLVGANLGQKLAQF